jgi:DNA polymerase
MLVKTVGPDNATIMVVGEAPGEQEDTQGIPFVGQSGQLLDKILGQAALSKHECILTNVAKIQPPGNQIAYYFENKAKTVPKPMLAEHIEMLRQDIISYKPNIIIALGRTALWALTGQPAISTARGFITDCTLVPGVKVLPTYHPRYVTENWEMLFPVIMDIRKAVTNSIKPGLVKDERILMSSPTKGEFIEFMQHAADCGKIAVDVETTSPGSHIDILGIATSPTEAMSFTFIRNRKPRFSNPRDEIDIWLQFAKLINTVPSIMHNGTYDSAVLTLNHGIFCKEYKDDTMVAAHVCWPEVPRSLSFLSSVCINVPSWKHLQTTMPAWYNASDAANTFGVYKVIRREILAGGHLPTYQFEMAQVKVANYLHLKGVKVDKDTQARLIAENVRDAKTSGAALAEAFGHEINFNSPKQMAKLLYQDLGLPPQYKRRKSVQEERKLTTDKEAITRLSRISNNPLLDLIVQHKKELKLKSFLDIKLSPTGRVHTNYNITGATMAHQKKAVVIDDDEHYKSFGRWSSSKSIILPYGSGNLQNIPRSVREMYVPDAGWWFVQADYKQAEAVIVAYIIGDEKLKDMFKQSFGKSLTRN